MKLAALNSLKFKKLKRRLSLAHWQTVGLLESLWLFTQANAIEGNIGKHSDEDIAAAIEWEGDAGELIQTLVECKLLDPCPVHRLLVHGWEKHAPTFIKGVISRHGKEFARHCTKQDDQQATKQPPSQASTLPSLTIPSLTLPCVALPQPASADAADTHTTNNSRKPKQKPLGSAERVVEKRNGGGNHRE